MDHLDEIIEKALGPIWAKIGPAYTMADLRAAAEAGIKHGMMEAPIIDRKHCEAIARRELARELLVLFDEYDKDGCANFTHFMETFRLGFRLRLIEIAEEGE